MLAGKKPPAAFQDVPDAEHLVATRQYFAPHVARGAIVEHAYENTFVRQDGEPLPMLRLLYTLPGDEWRAAAYLHLWDDAAKSGWTETHERREGELLGYDDWQNDFHMERWKILRAARRRIIRDHAG